MSGTPENLAWETSSFCSDAACVEVAVSGADVFVRNSQEPERVLRFTRSEWEVFRLGMANGEFR